MIPGDSRESFVAGATLKGRSGRPGRLGYPADRVMGLEITPRVPSSELAHAREPDDPEVERVKAALEARLLGGPQVSTRIGRFVVLERVGAGGMGVVFSAFDPQLDRKVAIKLLFEGETDERERARLLGEAKAMAKLAHPNVVGVYEVGEHRGRVFVAMEYVRGRSLKRWVGEKPRSRAEVLAMCVQAGRGLAAAHAAGIVHRDFKPDNVLISESPLGVGDDDRPRVLDFGLARLAADERIELGSPDASDSANDISLTKLTRTGALMGTPAYMAPEQIRGESIDARADQFAFCVTVWEALVGERPFAGDTVETLFDHVSRGDRRTPRRGAMTGRLEAVLRRGLASQPSDRYPSMDALLAALERGVTRRRAWLTVAAGGVALAGLGTWGAWGLELERRRAQCEAEASSIDEVWNDGAKARLREGLIGTGVSFAESTFEHAVPFVEAYVEAWRGDYEELCVATRVDRERSTELWAASRSCFDERRGELGSRLEVFAEEADAAAVQLAVPAVARLASLDQCRDDVWLARNSRFANDDVDLGALRQRLWRAEGLQAAGKYEEAMALASSIADAAVAAPDPLTQRSALLLAGTSARDSLAHDDAERFLGEAFDLALAAGDDDVAFAAASELVETVGYAMHARGQGTKRAREEGLWWARVARDLELRLGARDDLGTARLDVALALVVPSEGDPRYEDLVQLAERALEIRERVLGPDHPEVANSLLLLSDAKGYRDGTPLSAEVHDELVPLLERALAIQERALGPEHPVLMSTLTSLGGVHYLRGSSETTQRLCERVLASEASNRFAPCCLQILGHIHAGRGSIDEARQFYERSIASAALGLGPEHFGLTSALVVVAPRQAELEACASGFDAAQAVVGDAAREVRGVSGPGCASVGIAAADLALVRGDADGAQELLDDAEQTCARGEPTTEYDAVAVALWRPMDDRSSIELRRADIAALAGDSETALTLWQAVAAEVAKTPRQKLLSRNEAELQRRLAEYLGLAGRYEDAMLAAGRAHVTAAALPDTILSELDRANVAATFAMSLFDLGKFAAARDILEPIHARMIERCPAALWLRPGTRHPMFVLARARWETGDREGALDLAVRVREDLAALGPGRDADRREVVAWIADRAELSG